MVLVINMEIQTLVRLFFPPSLLLLSSNVLIKNYIFRVYLSPSNSNTSEHGDPFVVGEASRLPLLANSEHMETKSCLTYDLQSASVPKPAIQAFKLLSESPAAQVCFHLAPSLI